MLSTKGKKKKERNKKMRKQGIVDPALYGKRKKENEHDP